MFLELQSNEMGFRGTEGQTGNIQMVILSFRLDSHSENCRETWLGTRGAPRTTHSRESGVKSS